ncbi:MAG: hypothetical protein H7Y20_15380 [Bryobacteraceae bacterium]|nr:hypothetical protein [Bryobacteraceae bacterium]
MSTTPYGEVQTSKTGKEERFFRHPAQCDWLYYHDFDFAPSAFIHGVLHRQAGLIPNE